MPRSEEARHAYNLWRRVRRAADKVDPRLHVGECDGELFDGPAVDAWYMRAELRVGVPHGVHDDTIPEEEQRARLGALFLALEAKGLPVKYADLDTGASFPCLEVALDERHHNRVLAAVAKIAYELGPERAAEAADILGLRL